MDVNARIYVAGHTGLLGSAIIRALRSQGFVNIIINDRLLFDLTDERQTTAFFDEKRPEYVFLCAAKVGGITDNMAHPVDYLVTNTRIAFNVITSAHHFGVKKLLFFGANCMYPRECNQPIKEEYLYSGPLEPTNRSYAVAKLAGVELCRGYNVQYGTNFIVTVPASMYGENDHFGSSKAHVIADMLHKLHEAKENKLGEIVFWGDGSPLREFIYVDDVAGASIFLMENFNPSKKEINNGDIFLNLGSGEEMSMLNLALFVADAVGYRGKIIWDTSRPNGMPRKLLDSSKINAIGWRSRTGLREGIEKTYQWYLKNI